MLHEASTRERIDNDLLRRFHDDGDLQARERLAERCTPLVRSIANRYRRSGQEMEDLIQAGMVGLVKAIDRFDTTNGGRFISFAVPNIQGEIRRHFRDRTWAVHVPRSVQELDAKIQSTSRDVLQTTGHEVTVDELAQTLDVAPEQVKDAQAAGRAYRSLSLDQPAGEGQTLGDGRGQTDPGYARIDDRSVTDDAMQALDDRERRIVTMRFRDGMLQREIAEQVGVSQMQISRILRQAYERMHDRMVDHQDDQLAA